MHAGHSLDSAIWQDRVVVGDASRTSARGGADMHETNDPLRMPSYTLSALLSPCVQPGTSVEDRVLGHVNTG